MSPALRPEDLLLEEAIAVCRGAVGHGGAESGPKAELDSQRCRETEALTAWADTKDLWVEDLVPSPLADSKTREHHIFRVAEDPSRIYKITKGPGWGIFPASLATTRHKPVRYWFEDRPASPREYFERLLLSNTHLMHDLDREAYPELNRLEGFVISHGRLEAVTSQPVFIGTPAPPDQMAAWFIERGFIFIRSWTWFRPADGLAVFDAWIDNIMVCEHGLVPFDVIPLLAQGSLLDSLHAAVARLQS
ncbi:MAG: hypothetical protein HS117_17760 [Verrucomicrobiaceae bacterium]|nr:hypothetical protein [Verrucomicrobiaceae bacterium]